MINPATPATAARRGRNHRLVRQLHLWIGAWGALAAIVYGMTGLVMNHRGGDNAWPQGESIEAARTTLMIPAAARTSAEALSLWLRQTQGLDAQSIRKGGGRGESESNAKASARWTLSGGNARASWSLQYQPGTDRAEIRHTRQDWLAAFNRLHKGLGGGWAWSLLADSFALAMLLLGISGIWMWARGRTPRQKLLSVLALSSLLLALVLGTALA